MVESEARVEVEVDQARKLMTHAQKLATLTPSHSSSKNNNHDRRVDEQAKALATLQAQ